jgi:hypothetical protein
LLAAGFGSAALAAGTAGTTGAAGNGFAAVGLELSLGCFTFTFDVAMGIGLAGGFTAFLAAATFGFGVAFFMIALPGRLTALLGFFEGI